jgi:hypothetical protein
MKPIKGSSLGEAWSQVAAANIAKLPDLLGKKYRSA